jgi:outer membrane protein TolC
MQWSIDNAFKSKHAVAQANIHIEEQKSVMQIKQEEVNLKIRQAFLQREQAQQQVITAEKNIAQNTETVRVIKNSYLNQESMLTDLLEAENALLEAKFNHISALVELKLNHIQLLAITGIL